MTATMTWEDLPKQPWPDGTVAPPDALADWLTSLSREQLVWVLGRRQDVWAEESECFMRDHEGRITVLTQERDQAREEAGHLRAMKKYVDGEMRDYLQRLILAKKALVATGYFTEDQVTVDIAPRITELWASVSSARFDPTEEGPRA